MNKLYNICLAHAVDLARNIDPMSLKDGALAKYINDLANVLYENASKK